MPINNVSFGRVIALSGDQRKIKKINSKLAPQLNSGDVIVKDVTNHYRNAKSSGVLASAVKRGDRVEIYITGDDIKKVKQQHNEWDTIDGILSHLNLYYDTKKMGMYEIISKIF